MADQQDEVRIPIYINDEQAKSAFTNLRKKADEYRVAMHKAYAEGDMLGAKKMEKDLKSVEKKIGDIKKANFDVNKVLNNLSEASKKDLMRARAELTKYQETLRRGSKEYDQYSAKIKKVNGELNKMNAEMREQKGFMSTAADGFNKYFGVIAGGLASLAGATMAIRKAVDAANLREEVKDELSALTGLGEEAVNSLEKTAKQAATTTEENGIRIKQSADDILNAYKLMGSAKPELLKNAEALAEVTHQALILAEASKMQTAPAVEALASIMNQFNAPAGDATKFINILAAGSKEGAAEVNDLADAIIRSGAAAMGANITIEEEVGLVETLAEKGVKAERAGTGLRGAILKMQKGADEFNPKVVGMSQALENFAAKNLSTKEMMELFGEESYTVASLLINNRKRFDELTTAVTGTNVAFEQAKINTENNAAKLAQAKNKSHEYAVELGKKLQPAMTMVVSSGTMMLKVLSGLIDLFSKHGKAILVVSFAIAGLTLIQKANTNADKVKVFWNDKVIASMKNLFATIKANPWTAVTTLLFAAVVALQAWANKTKEATTAQRDFNELLKEGNDLLNDTKSIKDRAAIMNTLSKKQLENLKENINEQLTIEEEYNTKLLSELRKRFDSDIELKRLYRNLDNKENTDIQEAGIQNTIKLRKESIAEELQLEADKHNLNKKQLNEYLKSVETSIANYSDKGIDNPDAKREAEKSFFEYRKSLGLTTMAEQMAEELRLFNENEQSKLLSQDEYEKSVQRIKDRYVTFSLDSLTADEKSKAAFLKKQLEDEEAVKKAAREKEMQDEAEFEARKQAAYEKYHEYTPAELETEELKQLATTRQYELISYDEYLAAKKAIEDKYDAIEAENDVAKKQAKIEDAAEFAATVSAGAQQIGAIVQEMQNMELAAIQDKVAKGLMTEEQGKKEELKIKKKYADKQFIATAAQIVSATSLAVMQAWAQLGPIAGPIMGTIAAALGVVQLISANKERQRVKQLAKGKYNVIGLDDNQPYSANYTSNISTGLVKNPTLVGEEPEVVWSTRHTRDIITYNPALIEASRNPRNFDVIPKVNQRAAGKYDSLSTSTTMDASAMASVVNQFGAIVNQLQKNGLRANFTPKETRQISDQQALDASLLAKTRFK